MHEKNKNALTVFVGNPFGKRSLGDPRANGRKT
jgi:hypothetical protein